MEHVDELIPGHALHALDPDDERAVEAHLAGCERCRRQLREFEAVAGALAYAAPAAPPPRELRGRVLEAIGGVPAPDGAAPPIREPARPARQRPRRSWWPRLSVALVPALAAAVVALLVWNISLRGDLSDTRERVAAGSVVQLANVGNALTAPSGDVTLFADLAESPPGTRYAAWVIAGGNPLPAGAFEGGKPVELELTERARPGDVIAVTIEPDDRDLSRGPSRDPIAAGTVGET